ncbi:MAG: hypothetical protein Q8Q60_00170 [Candidatus Chromulinivorax sp.]|nr:hypothetical protein [Candidatus Chromulinivorax sp.]
MKRFILYILLFDFINVATIQDNQEYMITHANGEKSPTLYASYFLIKEFFKMDLHNYFIDHKKIKKASIYCYKCNHESDAHDLWIALIFKFNETPIDELKNYIYNKSTKDLALHILQKHQELELNCAYCGDYSGYYIPEQSRPQN